LHYERGFKYVESMTVELKPEQERIVREQIESGHFTSVDEVVADALSRLPHDRRFDRDARCEAVRRMLEFGETRGLSLGEPVTREFLHEGHRV
jgi:putative addiction module CopG family antidote